MSRKRHTKKGRHPKKPPVVKVRSGHCGSCGEKDKLRTLVVQVDAKVVHRAKVCRMCAACAVVRVVDHQSGYPRR